MEHECPMCGELMKRHTREVVTRVPGTSREIKLAVREWVCPECEYFEDDDSPPPKPE